MRSVGSEDRVAGVAKGFEARVVRVFVEEFGVGGVAVELGWEAG
jgi:hypothetical protein